MVIRGIALLFTLLSGSLVMASEAPRVGREAAAKYFRSSSPERVPAGTDADHYLALHVGRYTESQSWEWGRTGRKDGIGVFSAGLTYRLHEWSGSTDFGVRVDFNEYDVGGGVKPLKMSLLPIIMIPDATSRFPLYFGFGAGLGIFFKQVPEESPISLDYQLIAGARFFNVFENTGFFIESGLKNFITLTSSGQVNGVFLAAGAVFTF